MQHVTRDAVARRWLEQSAHLRCDQPDATSKQCVAEPLDSIQFLILRARQIPGKGLIIPHAGANETAAATSRLDIPRIARARVEGDPRLGGLRDTQE